uniref:Pre-rRNA-processing protein Ipi1 N-terminal domain-containing protein n=1 Tax=Plectus sambesii TaxID=2011161 RepID=A0A914XQ06_9BILA
MGKKAKKKLSKDFKKVKLKVGRTLKKPAVTDTTVHAKKLVLLEQLSRCSADVSNNPLSHRKLSLEDLIQQLGHYNKNSRKDALAGIKQLLADHEEMIVPNLRTLIPSVARLVTDDQCAATQLPVLRAVLELICRSTDTASMRPHFALLVAHFSLGLSHLMAGVKMFALACFDMILQIYPDLCLGSADVFSSFVGFLAAWERPKASEAKRTVSQKQRVLESLLKFLNVFAADGDHQSLSKTSARVLRISVDGNPTGPYSVSLQPRNGPFDFHVLSSTAERLSSPLESVDELIKLWQCAFPFLLNLLLETASDERPDLLLIGNVARGLKLLAAKAAKVRTTTESGERLRAELQKSLSKSVRRRLSQLCPLKGQDAGGANRLLVDAVAMLDALAAYRPA